MPVELMSKAASIPQLQRLARKRLPKFAYEYLVSGCISDCSVTVNRQDLDSLRLFPKYLRPCTEPDLMCEIVGKQFSMPLGMAPIGLSDLIWPRSAEFLAKAAKQANIPFTLSTVGSTSIERAAQLAEDCFWFQLYPPPDQKIRMDLIRRALDVGCEHLVVTVDVPYLGRRPKDLVNGISIPPKFTLENSFQTLMHPSWAFSTLRNGLPQFGSLLPYLGEQKSLKDIGNYVRATLKDIVDENLLKEIRDQWPHKLIVKGILGADDAQRAINIGADALVVSNHGGRQLDPAPSTISVLADVANVAKGSAELIVDSGMTSGVDICRFLSHGADMVLGGRAFMFGVAALGESGAEHTIDILKAELIQTMSQLRCQNREDIKNHL